MIDHRLQRRNCGAADLAPTGGQHFYLVSIPVLVEWHVDVTVPINPENIGTDAFTVRTIEWMRSVDILHEHTHTTCENVCECFRVGH